MPRAAFVGLATALALGGCATTTSEPEPPAASTVERSGGGGLSPQAGRPRALTIGDLRFVERAEDAAPLMGGSDTAASVAAAPAAASSPMIAQDAAGNDDWGVLLDTITGPGHAQAAGERAAALRSSLRRPDIRVVERRDGSAVLLGAYPSFDDAQAQTDLAWVQGLARPDGRPMFERVHLAPPDERFDGDTSERNLLMAKRIYGPAAEYTLEIGTYDLPSAAQRRRAAEEAVEVLRGEGQPAFYFHGARVSSVTVGVFTALDYSPDSNVRSPRVRELQGAHPHRFLNGYTQRVKGSGYQLPSVIKRIPEPPSGVR